MDKILFFFISIISSTIGGISGIGGGVIIKPALDALGGLDAAVVSFLSGCTVLSMSAASFLMTLRNKDHITLKCKLGLTLGSVCGGIFGKYLFDIIRNASENKNGITIIQTILLLLITFSIFIYMQIKERFKSFHFTSFFVYCITGLILGLISAFLGIGGGPLNVAVLYILFSMDMKEAARISLFIILFSQASSLCSMFLSDSIPGFDPFVLILMSVGGILGGILGRSLSAKLEKPVIEKLFQSVLLLIICVNIYNLMKYL